MTLLTYYECDRCGKQQDFMAEIHWTWNLENRQVHLCDECLEIWGKWLEEVEAR